MKWKLRFTSSEKASPKQLTSSPCLLCSIAMPPITKPDKFAGYPAQYHGFLLQHQLYFTAQRGLSDQSKIAVWDKGSESVSTYECFVTLFNQMFDHAPEGKGDGECC